MTEELNQAFETAHLYLHMQFISEESQFYNIHKSVQFSAPLNHLQKNKTELPLSPYFKS